MTCGCGARLFEGQLLCAECMEDMARDWGWSRYRGVSYPLNNTGVQRKNSIASRHRFSVLTDANRPKPKGGRKKKS